MNQSPSRVMPLLASATGVSILSALGLMGLSLLFFQWNPLLTLSALMILIASILNLMLLWVTHQHPHLSSSRFSQLTWAIGMAGSLIALIGAANDYLNSVAGHALILWYPLSQSIVVLGYGLVGIWLLALNYRARTGDLWPSRLASLGAITGIIMATGLFAIPRIFIPAVALNHEPLPEIAGWLGTVGWMLLYPLWSIGLGRAGIDRSEGMKNSLIEKPQQ